jgi:hypothetical protein
MLIKDKPPEEIKKFFDDFLTIVYYEDIKPMQDDMVAMHLTALCLAIFGAGLFLFKKIK